ncbi:formylglycine-generating enzyme family protein [Candidatus Uabimicrobium sp. HlEnr_7]|uniref:formylglycine-generating enzyme family protein n=1 Tax=Candidatus Uabimicrobium helgolandensis TaxID=3095367 RepID=UPI0035579B27
MQSNIHPTTPVIAPDSNQAKKISDLQETRRIILSELPIKDTTQDIKETQEFLVAIKNFIDTVRTLEEYEKKQRWCNEIFNKITDYTWKQAKTEVSEILYKWGRFLLDNGKYVEGLEKFWKIYEKFPDSKWYRTVFEELIAREQPKNMVFINDKNIDAYFIDIYPVTNLEYLEFLKDMNYPVPHHWKGNMYQVGTANHPVCWVSMEDAERYASWCSKRLPSVEEWEKAAMGPSNATWPWGDKYELKKCNCLDSGGKGTSVVGNYREGKSHYGCHDMAGNVWEWTGSWYSGDHTYKILKGGSWYTCKEYTENVYRYFDVPSVASGLYGFRCAKSFA